MLPTIDWTNPWLIAIALNTILLGIAWILPKKLLTPAGYVHAWILGILVWGTLTWSGYSVVMFYFLVGSGVTRIGQEQKEAEGIAEKREGARGPENVWGSALIAVICAILTLITEPNLKSLLLLGFVACFSTKLSDTTASEIGKAYGKRTFLITTFKPVPRGTEGAVSLEGTLAGIIASIILALVAWGVGMIESWGIAWCAIAAFIATNLESVIGATLQSKWQWLTNEIVNIINTLIGALVAIAIAYITLTFSSLGF